jgi:hypothetical protein
MASTDVVLFELRALRAEVAELRDLLERSPARRSSRRHSPLGPRDGADVQLLLTFADAIDRPLKASGFFEQAYTSPTIAAALLEGCIDNAKQLGRLFERLEGVLLPGGVRVDRVMIKRGTTWWRVSRESRESREITAPPVCPAECTE